MFITNDTAKSNPAIQGAMANYMKQLQAEEARRQAIREGLMPAPAGEFGTWNITDRH